jgi:type I restriction enzyme R subunit
MPSRVNELTFEYYILEELLASLGYPTAKGIDIAPGEPGAERGSYNQVLLLGRLQAALKRLNPNLPAAALEDAFRLILNLPHLSASLVANNRQFHTYLRDGIPVSFRTSEGTIRHDLARLVDFEHPSQNDMLAVNQFTVIENNHNRRPDVILFVNGLPLVVMELKDPKNPKADLRRAFNQIQTYRQDIPTLYTYNAACIISDNHDARVGTFTSPWERYNRWRSIDGETLIDKTRPQMPVVARGLLTPDRLLDVVRNFIVFEEYEEGNIEKKIAAYHQYYAVNKAVRSALLATRPDGRHQVGVVWHTQGSGKSLTMLFFAGKLIESPAMQNPTLVVITDRNDLDDQLFNTFVRGQSLLRQHPQQAESRDHLRKLLDVAAGGVFFTTVQKFLPETKGAKATAISKRNNIVVIADEAHRSQYGFIEGYARAMRDTLPNASFIGFTGTPIEFTDRSTPRVFGDYLSIYDIENSIEDEFTVPIYYEARLAKIDIDEALRPYLNTEFETITETAEESMRDELKRKWAALEAAIGTESRLRQVAQDILTHFEGRQAAIEGKAMIVTYSRRIAIDMYRQITCLHPEWHSSDPLDGEVKVIISGSADDPLEWQPYLLNKLTRKDVEKRFKDPADKLKIAIVCDMWLTGFDMPCLNTMYLDKPLEGHTLMQAIARVNRVYKDKQGGHVVDYLGVAEALRKAIGTYTRSGGKGEVAHTQEEAVKVMLEKYEIVCNLFHRFDWSRFKDGTFEQMQDCVADGVAFILGVEEGKKRLLQHVNELSKAFSLAVPHPAAIRIRDDVAFFQEVRAQIVKYTHTDSEFNFETMNTAIKQIVENAIVPRGVIDIFAAVGLEKPDISILSPEFLQGIQAMPQKDLAMELLRKLLNDEIKLREHKNLVLARDFATMLEKTIDQYHKRTIDAVQVIEEMIRIAKELKDADRQGEALGLNPDEFAFYTALADNESAVQVLGDKQLAIIAREVLDIVRKNTSIDWTERESVRANLRRLVKRVLLKWGYPPDKRDKATELVIEQAELSAMEMTE